MAEMEDLTVKITSALTPFADVVKATGIVFEALADIGPLIAEVREVCAPEVALLLENPKTADLENARQKRLEAIGELQEIIAAITVSDEIIAKIRAAI